jgi:hypothetical protein
MINNKELWQSRKDVLAMYAALRPFVKEIIFNDDIKGALQNLLKKGVNAVNPIFSSFVDFQDTAYQNTVALRTRNMTLINQGFQVGGPYAGNYGEPGQVDPRAKLMFIGLNPAINFDECCPRYFVQTDTIRHFSPIEFDADGNPTKVEVQDFPPNKPNNPWENMIDDWAGGNFEHAHIEINKKGLPSFFVNVFADQGVGNDISALDTGATYCVQKNGRSVSYWDELFNNVMSLLYPNEYNAIKNAQNDTTKISLARELMKKAVFTEAVPFRSMGGVGVRNFINNTKIWKNWGFKNNIIDNSAATVLIFVGREAQRVAVKDFQLNRNAIIGGQPFTLTPVRTGLFIPHPAAHISFATWIEQNLSANITLLQALL